MSDIPNLTTAIEQQCDGLRDKQQKAAHEADPDNLWVTDIPVCLHCGDAHPTAYGGGKAKMWRGDHQIVTEQCSTCDQSTIHLLK